MKPAFTKHSEQHGFIGPDNHADYPIEQSSTMLCQQC
jgi:hypothetical protein